MTTPAELRKAAEKEPEPSPYWVSLLYGDFGSRKTTTAAAMVKERGLLISADESWKVLLNDRHREVKSKLSPPYGKIIEYDSVSQLDYIDYEPYDTIIFDPISEAVDRYLDLLKDHAKWVGKGDTQRDTIQSSHPDLKGTQVVGFSDYRATRDKFRPVIRKLLHEVKANVIFTSHITVPLPGLGNQQKRPSLPEATLKLFGARADIIAMFSGNGDKFTADVTQSLTQLGKTRIETIQGKMSLESFINAYKERVF